MCEDGNLSIRNAVEFDGACDEGTLEKKSS